MHLTRPQAFALMVLAYVVGLVVNLLVSSAEATLAFALVLGLLLACYAYAYFVRDRR